MSELITAYLSTLICWKIFFKSLYRDVKHGKLKHVNAFIEGMAAGWGRGWEGSDRTSVWYVVFDPLGVFCFFFHGYISHAINQTQAILF